jgi:hypothetical protein
MTIEMPFLFSFLITLVIVLIINFISQTYLMKKNDYKIRWKSVAVLLIQSLLITVLLEWM